MIKPPSFWNTRVLASAEWAAENAFLPPGLHRLLTAFGLTSGLWLGRQFTDFVVARHSADGTEIPRHQVPEILRPLHGVMRYNQYSDRPEDRWKNVADGFLPVAFGVAGAYLGSKHFFHGKPSQLIFGKETASKALHAASGAVKDLDEKTLSINQAVAKMHWHESNAARPLGATGYIVSGTAGTHPLGALVPLSAGNIAIAFQLGAQRMINVFKTGFKAVDRYIIGFNRFMGNRSSGSVALPGSLASLVKWAEGNIEQGRELEHWVTKEELMRRAQDALQIFKKVPAGEQESVAAEIGKRVEKIATLAKSDDWKKLSQKDFSNKLNATLRGEFMNSGYESLLIHGIQNPETWKHFSIIGNGPFTEIARVFGSAKHEEQILEHIAKRLNPVLTKHFRDKGHEGIEIALNTKVKAHPLYVGAGGAGILGITFGGLAMGGLHHRQQRRLAYETDPAQQNSRHAQADRYYTEKKDKPKNIVEGVNSAPLDAAQWFSRVLIQPPSMHRFMNALFLSGALFGGYKFANVLTGRSLLLVKSADNFTSLIPKKQVWGILQPLHGLLEYTPGATTTKDRWNAALHMIIPVGIGAFGTMLGSHLYFKDRIDRIKSDKAEFLEDYVDKAALEQSKFFAKATGVTSIFNTGSGIHLLPFFNYSANMQNRFLMAGGYQVALPGVGKWWSGNEGLYPWGIKRTLNFTTNYLAYNPDQFPEQLPSLVHAVVAKLFPKPEYEDLAVKERQLLEKIYEVRDQYLVDGHVPEAKRPELLKAMKALLTGPGLERTLLSVGLDPRQADIANNGASGVLANFFGQGGNVSHLKKEYTSRYTERLAKQRENTEKPEYKKPERPISDRPFADRVKTDDHTIPVSL